MDIEVYSRHMSMLQSHYEMSVDPGSEYHDIELAKFYKELIVNLMDSKMFVVNDKMHWVFTETTPARIRDREIKALFEKMFICDRIILNSKYYLNGIHLEYDKSDKKAKVTTSIIPTHAEYETFRSTTFSFYIDLTNGKIPKNPMKRNGEIVITKTTENLAKKVAHRYLLNLFLFLNEPRVKVYVKSTNNERRIKKGKIAIPSLLITNINMELKQYINQSYDSKSTLEYSYMVRPHWRELRAERYGDNIGKMIFIASYKKGAGPMVDQVWNVGGNEV